MFRAQHAIWVQSRSRRQRDARGVIRGPFLGVEALNDGLVRKHELRARYTAVFPGVYVSKGVEPSFAERAEAAWLWSHRGGILAGLTASRLFGAKWVEDAHPVELVWPNARPPQGISTSTTRLFDGEVILLSGLPTTSLTRTAFDLARRRPLAAAVARLDSLGNANRLNGAAIGELVLRHRGARGVQQVARALDLHDPGAESPRETWLRLLAIGAGFPRPTTQIPVRGRSGRRYYLDMGWPESKIALEYDGDHHRTDKAQFARDITRLEELAELGWIVIRVAAGTPRGEVIRRLQAALRGQLPSTLR